MSGSDEWGNQLGFESQQDDSWGQRKGPTYDRPGSGGWHWLLSIVSILIVSGLSMGMAYLTRSVEERPVWMMGLIFMVPTAALMLAVMMVEGATSAMTPGTSRRPQTILAIIATVATFAVACICDLIYLQGFKKELAPAQSEITARIDSDRIILIEDSTASMQENGAHDQMVQAVEQILGEIPESSDVGLIAEGRNVPLQLLTGSQREDILNTVRQTPDRGRIYYEDLLLSALEMTEGAGIQGTTRLIFLTDGRQLWNAAGEIELMRRCMQDQIRIYCIFTGDGSNESLSEFAELTGGRTLDADAALSAVQGIRHARYNEVVAPAEVQEEIRLQQDLIRNRDTSAKVITCIMLTLEGLSLGICLSLMMSVSGQFRLQYIISPLMGILAFVLLKMIWSQDNMAATWWIKEGLSFSLLGIVLMARNRRKGYPGKRQVSMADQAQDSFYTSDSF